MRKGPEEPHSDDREHHIPLDSLIHPNATVFMAPKPDNPDSTEAKNYQELKDIVIGKVKERADTLHLKPLGTLLLRNSLGLSDQEIGQEDLEAYGNWEPTETEARTANLLGYAISIAMRDRIGAGFINHYQTPLRVIYKRDELLDAAIEAAKDIPAEKLACEFLADDESSEGPKQTIFPDWKLYYNYHQTPEGVDREPVLVLDKSEKIAQQVDDGQQKFEF